MIRASVQVLPVAYDAEVLINLLQARLRQQHTGITPKQAARLLGVRVSTVHKLCQRHKLQYIYKQRERGGLRHLSLQQVLEYDAERRRLGYRK